MPGYPDKFNGFSFADRFRDKEFIWQIPGISIRIDIAQDNFIINSVPLLRKIQTDEIYSGPCRFFSKF